MKTSPIQQQNYNQYQSFKALKPKTQAKFVNAGVAKIAKGAKDFANPRNESRMASFWQRVKAAWNLANKLQ